MPAEDDYGPTNNTRRQLLLQQQHHASASSSGVVAPSSGPGAQVAVSQGQPVSQQQQQPIPQVQIQANGAPTMPDRYHATTACPAGCSVAPDRLQATSQERLSERGSISSGSERLHPCYQNATSTERLERFAAATNQERFPSNAPTEKVEQTERLHPRDERFPTATVERYQHQQQPATSTPTTTEHRYTPTPSDRHHSASERLQTSGHCSSNGVERYRFAAPPDRYTPVSNIGSLDRYGAIPTTAPTTTDRYHTVEKFTDERPTNNSTLERYAERHSSNERFSTPEAYQQRVSNGQAFDRYRYHQERFQAGADYQQERFNCERFAPIPCPERFATQADRPFSSQERITYSQVPYIPPPSPAPASDRFIPPPPLSPTNTPSPDCYPSNPFPSPTTVAPTERFIPPPPLSPSPTEKFSPKPDRFQDKRYPDRYVVSPNPDKYQNNERYSQYHAPEPRYPERYPCYGTTERYPQQAQYHHQTERYAQNERYLPPTAHTPVERYVPQPQEPYYHQTYQSYERYPKWNQNNSGDPYMRRDLGYHHHYRLPVPFQQNHYQRMRYSHLGTPNRAKCCGQYQDAYQLSKSSPGSSSSSSSVTSQGKEIQQYVQNQAKDLQCYHQSDLLQPAFHQEKAIQCAAFQQQQQGKDLQCAVGFPSAAVRSSKVPCKHVCSSPSVEYVGQSGGRHVCATPPPPRSASVGGESHCGDQCCLRRPQTTTLHTTTIWRASGHHPSAPPANPSPTPANQPQQPDEQPSPAVEQAPPSKPTPIPVIQRAISLPAAPVTAPVTSSITDRYHHHPQQQEQPTQTRRIDYTQSERIPNRERPKFARSASRKEAVKNFIRKETANFFGVDEETEVDQQLRWLDRRKRLASRTYGPLKDEFQAPSIRTLRRPATVSFAGPAGGSDVSLAAAAVPSLETTPPPPYPGDRPDVLPAPSDVPDAPEIRYPDATVRRKESVARMTWDGISYVVNTLTKHRPRPRSQTRQWSRSYPPEEGPSDTLEDDVFFERPTTPASPNVPEAAVPVDSPDAPLDPRPPPARYSTRSGAPAWRRDTLTARRDQARPEIGGSRIWSAMLDSVLDNSDRRQYGMGWVGKMFGRSMRTSVARDEKVKQQLDDLEDYRPLFTYWVTTVQVLVLAISLVCYGFGPFGVDLQQRSGQVLVTSLSLQQVEYMEPANFWFGPRAADLIHLGAKFAPCMRIDNKIMKQIDKTREKERETACCIRNDDSGCVQSSQADCSKTISTWKKWSAGDSGPGGRISGSVCGLDPKFCDAPASVHPYEWPDDITKWPICRKTNSFTQRRGPGSGGTTVGTSARDKLAEHMVCEVIGHPCCIGIHGQCRITTREYCDFVRGHFHEEASLCSQVSCLDDVCGMVPFYFAESPDQFYRLWTSLFLHAGVLQLVVTVLIQHYLMRDLEKLTGPLRIGIIYIGSGVAGNLASSIFVPYRADVGPSGSQFGLLACLIVEVLNSWPILKHPHHALFKLLSITFVLLLFGMLPWVDNYSHIFGFVFGFLLSYAFLPFVSFGPYDRQRKIVLIWVCLTSAAVLFFCLVLLFYIIPVYDCEVCSYFNCLPLTRDFCASQNINFMREEPVV